ncbi:MAG: hypothetical protein LBR26_12060 [Prevotella sp.]|jgi:hypothetical protein|nr:hypothetical protein [Prevotella sp.]
MTYPPGSIILVKGYKLPTEEKDKFFIVMDQKEDEYNLLSMTTSRFYFSEDIIKHGVINEGSGASMYCFEKDRVIGVDGFAFRKHTFINHNGNIHRFSFELLSGYPVELMDTLTDNELQNLIYSFYRYKGIPKKYKTVLETVLNSICK